MGQVTAICSDKTGTLTQNKMAVTRVVSQQGTIQVGHGHSEISQCPAQWLELLRQSVSINSTAIVTLDANKKISNVVGSKTEGALIGLLNEMGVDGPSQEERVGEVPFSSARKRMTTVMRRGDGVGFRVLTKGAPEVVLALCTHERGDRDSDIVSPLTDHRRTEILRDVADLGKLGLRTLLAAFKDIDQYTKDDKVEADLVLLCVFGIEDPVRKEVPGAIRVCQEAGITVRMVTGDNKFTAMKIAQDCGIYSKGQLVLEGPEFRALEESQRDQLLPDLRVLARSSPHDKYILVQSLQRLGEVVAVTGDGTNDAPALKEATIGFAMGIQGTDLAKNASDIVLLNDQFDTILHALLWGRNVYACIQKFLQFQFAINFTSCMITLVGAATSEGAPLNSVMLLWINLIMDTLGALAIATEWPDPRLLLQKPRRIDDPVVSRGMWFYVFTQSGWQLAVQFWLLYRGYRFFNIDDNDKTGIRTVIFNVNIMMQLVNETMARHLQFTPNLLLGIHKNRFFIPILLLIFGVQVMLVQLGGSFVDTKSLNFEQWLKSVLVALVGFPMGWISQLIHVYDDAQKKKQKQSGGGFEMKDPLTRARVKQQFSATVVE